MLRALQILDAELVAAVDAAGQEAVRRAGPHLVCRLGCTDCCHGPFPVDALDAQRLRAGLDALEATAPERASRVRERARVALEQLRPRFPGDPRSGHLSEDAPQLEDFLTRHAALPCPALDPASGGCDLYGSRPLACRTFGPPVELAGVRLAPCQLCFQGADTVTIEACRVTPDLRAEDRAFAELARAGADPDVETLVAFVLAE